MDRLKRAGKPTLVVGVLALILALLFGATIGAPTARAGIAHQPLTPAHHDHGMWSGGDDGGRQPLMLHAEGEQVETPDVAGHAIAGVATGAAAQQPLPALVETLTWAHPAPAPVRSALQVWRT